LVREQYVLRDFVTDGTDDPDDLVDRAVLERQIIRARLAEDERYAPRAAGLAKLAIELKERALRDGEGPGLLQVLRTGLENLGEFASDETNGTPPGVVAEPEPSGSLDAADAE